MFANIPQFVANLFGTGLPWHRVVAVAAGNVWFKVRGCHSCCGNPGAPGC